MTRCALPSRPVPTRPAPTTAMSTITTRCPIIRNTPSGPMLITARPISAAPSPVPTTETQCWREARLRRSALRRPMCTAFCRPTSTVPHCRRKAHPITICSSATRAISCRNMISTWISPTRKNPPSPGRTTFGADIRRSLPGFRQLHSATHWRGDGGRARRSPDVPAGLPQFRRSRIPGC